MAKTIKDWLDGDVAGVQNKCIRWLSERHFFRDPIRPIYTDSNYFFSPADGIILYQRRVDPREALVEIKGRMFTLRDAMRDPQFDEECLVVGVFMTFYDVHVNRIPYSGRLTYRELEPIDTHNYPMLDVEKELIRSMRVEMRAASYLHNNQRVLNRIYAADLGQSYYILQIADFDVDSIIPFDIKQNQPRSQNERFGQIRYGSQVDLIVPVSSRFDFEFTQEPGLHVEAGLDTLIRIKRKRGEEPMISNRGNNGVATDDEAVITTPPRITEPDPAAVTEAQNPTCLNKPAFVMNFPFSLATDQPNNIWMRELEPRDRVIDRRNAYKQFTDLYHYVSSDAIVYLLPTPRRCRLQDLVYTGNLGIVLEHLPDHNTVVLANFESKPRVGETRVGEAFFRAMGYDVHVPPTSFEGEADLKHLHDNVYVGGYGMRSEYETFEWMEETFDMEIVKVEKSDEYLYHLDCMVFPVTSENTIVCTELLDAEEVAELEKHTNILDVSADHAFSGLCNSVRLYNTIMNASHITNLRAGTDEYAEELSKNRRLEDLVVPLGFEVKYFNLCEYHKSGALLSCMIMHLNRCSYRFQLL